MGKESSSRDVGATGDDAETLLDRPTPVSGDGVEAPEDDATGVPGASSGSTVGSPLEAMREEEAHQARVIIRLGRVFGLAVVAVLPMVPGSIVLRWVFAGAVVVAVAIGLWLERLFRDPARYTEGRLFILIIPVTVAVYAAILVWGVLSMVTVFAVLGIYFFCRRQSLPWAVAVVMLAAAIHATLWALIAFDVMADPGLVATVELSRPMQVFGIGAVLCGYLGAFLLGHSSHRATLEAIEKLQRATQLAAQREALLHEARQDLESALQLGGAGRYSGRTFGSYQMGSVIGRGGMGEVYEATHVDTGEIAAAKLLHLQSLDDPRQVARFLREMDAVKRIDSPHIARVIEACEPTDPVPYLIMERLRGHDLAHHLRFPRALTRAGLDKLLREVGDVLDAARERAIVHRDLKPRNLFLAERGAQAPIWKVLDFGVATLSGSSGTLTRGHVVGTPAYMAPEQARGKPVDHRADVYALAAIAYRWLCGRPAYAGRELPHMLYQVVHTMPQRPSALTDLSEDVDAALAIGLAKSANHRFDRAGELADALRAALDGRLDPKLRNRGRALVAAHPWGASRE